jgi:hypothetical protein
VHLKSAGRVFVELCQENMIQKEFADRIVEIIKVDSSIIGLAAAGSWITNEMDEFSDLDLVLVTTERVSDSKEKMLQYANQYGQLVSAFTGEHVGEPRLLICLYKDPLLHVDIKFLTIDEFESRVEEPVILWDTNGQLQQVLDRTEGKFPYPDFQLMEDRFWVWIHYVLGKIARGEYLEAFDSLSIFRGMIFGPLLHIKNGNLPKGVRKVEMLLANNDLKDLEGTIATYDKRSLIGAVERSINVYKILRNELFEEDVIPRMDAEKAVLKYLEQMNK